MRGVGAELDQMGEKSLREDVQILEEGTRVHRHELFDFRVSEMAAADTGRAYTHGGQTGGRIRLQTASVKEQQ